MTITPPQSADRSPNSISMSVHAPAGSDGKWNANGHAHLHTPRRNGVNRDPNLLSVVSSDDERISLASSGMEMGHY